MQPFIFGMQKTNRWVSPLSLPAFPILSEPWQRWIIRIPENVKAKSKTKFIHHLARFGPISICCNSMLDPGRRNMVSVGKMKEQLHQFNCVEHPGMQSALRLVALKFQAMKHRQNLRFFHKRNDLLQAEHLAPN